MRCEASTELEYSTLSGSSDHVFVFLPLPFWSVRRTIYQRPLLRRRLKVQRSPPPVLVHAPHLHKSGKWIRYHTLSLRIQWNVSTVFCTLHTTTGCSTPHSRTHAVDWHTYPIYVIVSQLGGKFSNLIWYRIVFLLRPYRTNERQTR
jgi:hypothetical protein